MRNRLTFLTGCLISLSCFLNAQEKPTDDTRSIFAKGKYNLEVGAGLSTYQGDLTEKSTFFGQPGYAASVGSTYNFSKNFSIGLGFSYMKLRADDRKNDKPVLKARNLKFKSTVWDINVMLQTHPYTFGAITPYIQAGAGLFHFNPTTVDRFGKKQYLNTLGTEGQGLLLDDNTYYSLAQVQIPFGGGIQYSINQRMAIKLDFLFRKTFTDYIDDVSGTYPNGLLIGVKLPITKQLTFRADEINPAATYPATGTPRGNPGQKDFYYTGQVKFVYQLEKRLL